MPSPALPVRRAGLALAGALAAALAAVPAAFASPDRADTLVVHSTRQMELHAPSEKVLYLVANQLDYAALQFERHIGERVPTIPVYVCSSAEQARARAPQPGATPSARCLVWIGPTLRAPGAGAKRAPAAAAARRAAPASADPEPAFLHAYGHAIVDAWAARARRAAGAMAGGIGVTGLAPGDSEKHATDPALPAWFQEAIATLCEPVRAQRERLEAARAALDRRIPFTELLAGPLPAEPARARVFVDESHALMRFIIEREDEPFLRQIAVGVVAGKPSSEVLVNAKTIYSRPEALEKQWVEWMSRPAAATR